VNSEIPSISASSHCFMPESFRAFRIISFFIMNHLTFLLTFCCCCCIIFVGVLLGFCGHPYYMTTATT
jgi:hypothetical protein